MTLKTAVGCVVVLRYEINKLYVHCYQNGCSHFHVVPSPVTPNKNYVLKELFYKYLFQIYSSEIYKFQQFLAAQISEHLICNCPY